MRFVLNGGIESFKVSDEILSSGKVHGIMIGRAAYKNPWMFSTADDHFYCESSAGVSRADVLSSYLDYCELAQLRNDYGSSIPNMLKPLHYFFHGAGQGNQAYKQRLDALTNDRQDRGIDDIVYEAIEGNIPKSFLETSIISSLN